MAYKHRKLQSRFLTVLVAITVFLVCFIVLDVVLSATHLMGARKSWSQPDPDIGWRMSPGRAYWYNLENDHAISGRINDLGWRDHARSPLKPPGTFRIAVMGDSFVEAMQVELDSTFVSIMERRLRTNLGGPVEVMNFGRSGMSQAEEWFVLNGEVSICDPDIVVLLFLPVNDISEISPRTADTLLRPFPNFAARTLELDTSFADSRQYRMRALINPLKQNSALVSLIVERYNLLRRTHRREAVQAIGIGTRIPGALSLCTASPDPLYANNYRVNKRLIARIAERCQSRGMQFVLVCTEWVYRPENIERYRAIDPSFAPDFFDRDLRAFADSLQVAYVGLQQPFEDTYRATAVPLRWHHWNYAGHRLVADVVTAKITEVAGAMTPPPQNGY